MSNYNAISGEMIKSDGTVINVADLLGGTDMGKKVDISKYIPRSGNMVKSDGTVVNVADVIEQLLKGGSGDNMTAETVQKMIDDTITNALNSEV